jgi:hypothetical protein
MTKRERIGLLLLVAATAAAWIGILFIAYLSIR